MAAPRLVFQIVLLDMMVSLMVLVLSLKLAVIEVLLLEFVMVVAGW